MYNYIRRVLKFVSHCLTANRIYVFRFYYVLHDPEVACE